jgi:hypothetical protein
LEKILILRFNKEQMRWLIAEQEQKRIKTRPHKTQMQPSRSPENKLKAKYIKIY